MSLISRTRRQRLVTLCCASLAATASTFFLSEGSFAQDVLVAGSVCEAQELKARKARNPRIEIEIPPEHDKSHPTLEACQAHDEAWNENNEGPRQPIPFSHKHHAGYLEMDCQYCHSGTDVSRAAGVPSVEVCMGCHAQFPAEYDQMEGIKILKQHWEEKKPIEWNQVHRLPEHVKFRHNRHIQFGLECQQCHGPVESMDRVRVQPDTTWKYFVPAKTLEMGWCIQCHRKEDHQAATDCMKCHM
ncbi:MAG: cytochrome c3 family protein [Myxococcota bacterium]|nr:cytochrome c3 family protein [Myxococcota bacterium]